MIEEDAKPMNYSSTQEKWKKIVQLQNRYEISNQRRIRNATGCSSPHICRVAQGKRKTTGGYKWVYANKLGGGLNTETI